MAITTVGFDGTVSEAQWSRFMGAQSEVAYKHGVTTGFVTAVGAGTRDVNVSAGTAVLPGVLVDSTTTVTKAFAANSTGADRVDYLVLRGNWATNAVTVEVVQGAGTTAPGLTQTEGTLWEMPLARVTVRPSVSTLLSTDVVVCKPVPRKDILYSASPTGANLAYNATFTTASTLTVPDPGWPFLLDITARGRFTSAATGLGIIRITANSVELGRGHSIALSNGTQDVLVSLTGGIYTSGPVPVSYQVAPSGMSSGSSLVLGPGLATQFFVRVVPA